MKALQDRIFNVSSDAEFERLAMEVFHLQAGENAVYKDYLKQLKVDPAAVTIVSQIPFLPVEFFKYFEVITGVTNAAAVFTSSGTTGAEQSKHYVTDLTLYEASFKKCFELFYGSVSQYCILGLLPSYIERDGSSLIYMIRDLMTSGGHPLSNFYLHNTDELYETLVSLQKEPKTKVLLIGVTYALLDFVDQYKVNFPELIVMETGGMKGKRREIVREELHTALGAGFGVKHIHSEYGMTELLSQAYSKGKGIFKTPPWMRVLIRDTNDPVRILDTQQTGGINIIDLANINSCSFIATQDLGKRYADGSFEVVGRFDNSDIRGCNLLVS